MTARPDRARTMEHQVASQRNDPGYDVIEQEVSDQIRVAGFVGDECHVITAELEGGPAGKLDGESPSDPVLDGPRVVRVVGAAVDRRLRRCAERDSIRHVGWPSRSAWKRELDLAREHEPVDQVAEVRHHAGSR